MKEILFLCVVIMIVLFIAAFAFLISSFVIAKNDYTETSKVTTYRVIAVILFLLAIAVCAFGVHEKLETDRLNRDFALRAIEEYGVKNDPYSLGGYR